MAYQQPDTALHHLKMAYSYLEDARKVGEKIKEANSSVSAQQLAILVNAANHLNQARTLDPNEVLWVDEEKNQTRTKIDQDFLNGEVLLVEGVAHLNTALDHSSHYIYGDNRVYKPTFRAGSESLIKARDALVKALTYRPYSEEALKFLAKTYYHLGDAENYRKTLERHIQIRPENIELHKQMEDLSARPPHPLFSKPGFEPKMHHVLLGCIFFGVLLLILAAATQSGAPVGMGIFFFAIGGFGFWVREKLGFG
jgi:tetratricopeptide (TPR) repeat protein